MFMYVFCISTSLVSKMVDYTNQYREENKLKPLKSLKILDQAAQYQADYMCKANALTHKHPLKKSLSERLLKYDYVGEKIGENIAKQSGNDYTQVFNVWISNKPHNDNIKGNYEHLGVGTCRNDSGERYWVQVFGRRSKSYVNENKEPIVVFKSGRGDKILRRLIKNNKIKCNAKQIKKQTEMEELKNDNKPKNKIQDILEHYSRKNPIKQNTQSLSIVNTNIHKTDDAEKIKTNEVEPNDNASQDNISKSINSIINSLLYGNDESIKMNSNTNSDVKTTEKISIETQNNIKSTSSTSFLNLLNTDVTQTQMVTSSDKYSSLLSAIYENDTSLGENISKVLHLLTNNKASTYNTSITTNSQNASSTRMTEEINTQKNNVEMNTNDNIKLKIINLLRELTSSDSNAKFAGLPIISLISTLSGDIPITTTSKMLNSIEMNNVDSINPTVKHETLEQLKTNDAIQSYNKNLNETKTREIDDRKDILPTRDKYDQMENTNNQSKTNERKNIMPFNSHLDYFLNSLRYNQSGKIDNTQVTNNTTKLQSLETEKSLNNNTSISIPVQSLLLFAMKNNDLDVKNRNNDEAMTMQSEISKLVYDYDSHDSTGTVNPMHSLIVNIINNNKKIHISDMSNNKQATPVKSDLYKYNDINTIKTSINDSKTPGKITTESKVDNNIHSIGNNDDEYSISLSKSIQTKIPSMEDRHLETRTLTNDFNLPSIDHNDVKEYPKIQRHDDNITESFGNAIYENTINTYGLNQFISDANEKNVANMGGGTLNNLQKQKTLLENNKQNDNARQYQPQYEYIADDYSLLTRYPKSVDSKSILPYNNQPYEQENPKITKPKSQGTNFYSGTIKDLKELLNNQRYKDRSIQILFSDGNQLDFSDVEVGESLECGS